MSVVLLFFCFSFFWLCLELERLLSLSKKKTFIPNNEKAFFNA